MTAAQLPAARRVVRAGKPVHAGKVSLWQCCRCRQQSLCLPAGLGTSFLVPTCEQGLKPRLILHISHFIITQMLPYRVSVGRQAGKKSANQLQLDTHRFCKLSVSCDTLLQGFWEHSCWRGWPSCCS